MFSLVNFLLSTSLMSFLWFYKPVRFYLMSFFFDWLYENPNVGKFLGIKYENDYDLIFRRRDTVMYTPGIYSLLVEWFMQIKINLETDIFKKLINVQFNVAKKIDFNSYLNILDNKYMSLEEFENYLAESFLIEINNELKFLSDDKISLIIEHNKLIRNILNGLTRGSENLFYKIMTNFDKVLDLRKILLTISPEERLFLIIPQMTILTKFVEMIINKKGNLQDLEFYEFVMPVSFFTMINNGELYMIHRHIDKKNSYSNNGFGVNGFRCPASQFVFKVISNIIDNLKKFKIDIIGEPIYLKSKRFKKNIINKNDVFLKINYLSKTVDETSEEKEYK